MIPVDDFDDGSDVGWTRIDSTVGQLWGSGTFDASSQAYHLESSDLVPVGAPGGGFLASFWDQSAAPIFSNGYLRAKIRAETEGTFISLALRTSGSLETGFNAYLLGAYAPGSFVFNKVAANETVRAVGLNPNEFPFGINEDWIIEAGAIGNELSLKFWRPGDPEPAFPQMTIRDSSYSTGTFGVEANIETGEPFPEPARVSATFDDIVFTVPESSTIALAVLGFAGLLTCPMRRWRTKLGH